MINSGLFKINGHTYKAPSNLAPVISTLVDSGRNTNGTVVGQKVGRDIYKLNNLQWNMLTVAEWRDILAEFGDFYVEISFFAPDTASWKTLKMYPGDRTCEYPKGEMWYNNDGSPKVWFNCKVNVIDVGEV